MVRFSAYRKLGHDADILQYIVALDSVGLDLIELVIFKSAVLIKDLSPYADLADIMQQRNIAVLLDSLFVITHLFGQHSRIAGDSRGVTFGISVLHIDRFRECLNDLSDERPVFFLLLQECLCFLIRISINDYRRTAD